jgi:putative GTP pyrophosphokinase
MTSELQTTASYIAPEHLIAKIIRKKLEQPALDFDISSYEARVTDLIGIRALHLFKNEWRTIHQFVTETWDLHEKPIAYVRDGDAEDLICDFEKADCDVRKHSFGYRSIHYVLKSQPAKCVQLAELQVRTIFEEGWSEIDHRVRYPRQSNNPYLASYIILFNRLAGSADEMGTFIESLSVYMSEQAASVAERETRISKVEAELKATVSRLQISEVEKANLQKQIGELRNSSTSLGSVTFSGLLSPDLPAWNLESGHS